MIIFSVLLSLALPLATAAQGKIAFNSTQDGNQEIYVMNSNGTGQNRLTFNNAVDGKASFSPGGSKIAFHSERDGNFEIYVMDWNGANQTRLTNNSAIDMEPEFSPDGSKIVFLSNRDGNNELYIMNADGSNQIRLTENTVADHQPTFSPDGTKIAFSRILDIWVMNVDGTGAVQLTTHPGVDLDPAFSPDGTKIAFRSNRLISSNEEIYIMNTDGSNPQQLTTTVGADFDPAYSPDGTKIVFSTAREGDLEIYVMNSQGGSQQPLTNNTANEVAPAWTDAISFPAELMNVIISPPIVNEGDMATLSGSILSFDSSQSISLTVNWGDGSEQVFSYPAGTTSFSEIHSYLDDGVYSVSLVLTTANGSDPTSVIVPVNNVAPALFVTNPLPAVVGSPVILSGSVNDPGTLDAHIVHISWGDGSPTTVLNLGAGVSNFSSNHSYATLGLFNISVQAADDDNAPATPAQVLVGIVPPPTSGKVAFTSNFGGNNNIWLMDSNGTNQVALTTNPASDSYPDLSNDGSKIVFVSDRDGNPEIYSMNAAGSFQTRLTSNAATESEPAFSPDGSKIVFSSNRDGNHEIYIMNANGTNQTRLTTNAGDDGNAEFSPNGTKIIFARLSTSQTDSHIWTMNLDGTGQAPLTTGSFQLNGYPSFSPNGQRIVFSSVRPLSHTNAEVYIMNADGTGQVRLTTASGNDLEPVFSPSGSQIAFRAERDGNAEIYIMDSDGTDQNRITFDGPPTSNFAPSWAAVPTVSVDIPDDLAREQGSTLIVPIVVSDTTGYGIVSYDFALNFDPAVLAPQAVSFDKAGTLSANFEINAGTGTPGRLVISGFGTATLSGAGTLLNLKFNVIGNPPTSSDLVLNPFVFNEGIPFVEVSAGRVFVQGTLRGTVLYGTSATTRGVPNVHLSAQGTPSTSTDTATDGTYVLGGFGPGAYTVTPSKTGDNGGITALDASLVSQFLVGTAALTNNQQAAGEVSGNGTLTSFDAAQIAQYVVALPNSGRTGIWVFLPPFSNYATIGNLTGENYTAILMGEVSGNWTSQFTAGLSSLRTTESQQPQQQRGKPAGGLTATLPSLRARPNEQITVPVSLKFTGPTAIQAYQFDLLFDPGVLQLETTPVETSGTLSNGLAVVTNGLEPGRLRLAVYGTNRISTSGALVNFRFRVIGGNGSSSPLDFSGIMFNEGNPAVEGKNGKVSVRR